MDDVVVVEETEPILKRVSEMSAKEKFAHFARKPRGGRPRGSKDAVKVVTADRILALRKTGLSYADVASLVGMSESHVRSVCDKHAELLTDVLEYSKAKADIVEAIQRKIVLSLDDKTIKDAPFRDRVQAVVALEGMIRKDRGLDDKRVVNVFALTIKQAYEKRSEGSDKVITLEVEDGGKDMGSEV